MQFIIKFCIVASVCGNDAVMSSEYFNILSIDGGGIRGLIPATIIEKLEKDAWSYIKLKNYTYDDGQYGEKMRERVAMKDLFNMTAGTSTGSIIAAGLSYPVNDTEIPKMSATDLIDIYKNQGDKIFIDKELGPILSVFYGVLVTALFGLMGLILGSCCFDNNKIRTALDDVDRRISTVKNRDKQYDPLKANCSQVLKKYLQKNEGKIIKKSFKRAKKVSNNSPNEELVDHRVQRLFNFDDSSSSDPDTTKLKASKMQHQIKQGVLNQVKEKLNQNAMGIQSKQIIRLRFGSDFMAKIDGCEQFSKSELKELKQEHESKVLRYECCHIFKWVVILIFLIMGLCAGYYIPNYSYKLANGLYSREGLDEMMNDTYGDKNVEDALTDEILIVAYEYNSQQPRFYSKYFTSQDPAIYSIPMANATAASSSAPGFFTPKLSSNEYGLPEILIDGGLICNNPSLYAYEIASIFHKKEKVRILSLGTGEKPFRPINGEGSWTKFDWLKNFNAKDEFVMNMDVYTADWYLKELYEVFYGRPKDYLRLQTTTTYSMNQIDTYTTDGLSQDGIKLYDTHKEKILEMIHQIIDERYGLPQ